MQLSQNRGASLKRLIGAVLLTLGLLWLTFTVAKVALALIF